MLPGSFNFSLLVNRIMDMGTKRPKQPDLPRKLSGMDPIQNSKNDYRARVEDAAPLWLQKRGIFLSLGANHALKFSFGCKMFWTFFHIPQPTSSFFSFLILFVF
jgi:hypothetical protein